MLTRRGNHRLEHFQRTIHRSIEIVPGEGFRCTRKDSYLPYSNVHGPLQALQIWHEHRVTHRATHVQRRYNLLRIA